MSAALFAVTAAVCFALSYVATTFGLQVTSSVNGVVVSLAASSLVSGVALLIDWPGAWSAPAMVFFIVGGLVAPGLSRLTSALGVERLGPSLAVPLQSGVRPLLAVLAGAVVLSEDVGATRVVSAIAVSVGLARLSLRVRRPGAINRGTTGDIAVTAGNAAAAPRRGATVLAVAFPLLTGAFFAASDVLKKQGLDHQPHPLLAAAVSTLAATLVWGGAAVVWRPLRRRVAPRRGAFWFVVAGALIAVANISLMYALRAGDVSVVGPISSTSPLVVFLLSVLFLRDIEHLETETVVWGALVVLGTAVLATS